MKASVIVTCYNLGAYLDEAVSSALASTHTDLEVIVVDDGSTDAGTKEIVGQLESRYASDKRVQIIRQPNQGLSGARNTGIRAATGDCILPLDADDRIRPESIAKAIAILEKQPKVGVVYGWAELFGARTESREYPPFDQKEMLLGNRVPACAAFRKKVWQDVGGYDTERFKEGYEDWDFWLGAIAKGWEFHLLQEPFFDYRMRPDSMVSRCNEPGIRSKLVTQLIDKHKSLYAACWPELLIRRELTTLEYERMVAAYHQRFIESLAEFHHYAKDWNARCTQLEESATRHRAALHHLRHVIAFHRWLDQSWLGRAMARLRTGKTT